MYCIDIAYLLASIFLVVEVEEDGVDRLPQRLVQRVHRRDLRPATLHVLQEDGQLDLALHEQLVYVRGHLGLKCLERVGVVKSFQQVDTTFTG